jgi:hypothetical protein
VLGAVAQLERALISDRTKAGIKAVKARGKLPGNPGLREHRREAIRTIAAARNQVYLGDLIASAPTWLPTIQRMRPQHSWGDVIRVVGKSKFVGLKALAAGASIISGFRFTN